MWEVQSHLGKEARSLCRGAMAKNFRVADICIPTRILPTGSSPRVSGSQSELAASERTLFRKIRGFMSKSEREGKTSMTNWKGGSPCHEITASGRAINKVA